MQSTNNMTFIPEEYAKVTDAQKTAMYDVRKEARDEAPFRFLSTVTTAFAPAVAPAPAPAPTQRTVQATGLVSTAPAALPADHSNDIHQILSQAATWSTLQAEQPPAAPTTTNDMFIHEGVVYQVTHHNMHYTVKGNNAAFKSGVLIDRGANVGLSGSDVEVIEISYCRADITGIADQTIHALPFALVAGKIQTKSGFIIGVFYQ
jgi:hypothetical protein